MKMKKWIWVILCVVSFGAGYGLHAALHKDDAETEFRRVLSWAIENGWLTVNPEKITEEQKEVMAPYTGTTRNLSPPPAMSPGDIPLP